MPPLRAPRTRGFAWALAALALLALASAVAGEPRAAEGAELLGRAAPPIRAEHWLNSRPLELAALRGRVVLVRFWTAPDCPFCSASAPALNDFHARYAQRGLTVIGLYHHKAGGPLDPRAVERYARQFGFRFPVAIDPDWQTLRAYWLDTPRRFTSASFLIDRRGLIRHVHPGGKYEQGDAAHADLQAMIERLCDEPSAT
jgi:peroxiredoxin